MEVLVGKSKESVVNIELGDVFVDEEGKAYLLVESYREGVAYYILQSFDGKESKKNNSFSEITNSLKWSISDAILKHYPKSKWSLVLEKL